MVLWLKMKREKCRPSEVKSRFENKSLFFLTLFLSYRARFPKGATGSNEQLLGSGWEKLRLILLQLVVLLLVVWPVGRMAHAREERKNPPSDPRTGKPVRQSVCHPTNHPPTSQPSHQAGHDSKQGKSPEKPCARTVLD